MRRTLLLTTLVAALALAVTACGNGDDGTQGQAPAPPDEATGFDEEASIAGARAYLGVAEADVEETVMVRIMRRGEEHLAGTMDLRPGRFNLELDEDDAGVYRVTRVLVETEDGQRVVE